MCVLYERLLWLALYSSLYYVQTLLGYIIIIIGVKNKWLLNGGGDGNRLNKTNQYIK